MEVLRTEFKGHKMIQFKESMDDKYGLSFGLRKARIILDHIDDIKKFVEEESDESG